MGATIVTGASSGIGRSLAKRLAERGEPIAALARRQELLDSLVDEIEAAGGRAIAIGCDVTDLGAVSEAVRRAEAELGPTQRLVANVGGGDRTDAENFSAEHMAYMIDLNLMGCANCIEAVLPGMLERRSGHLVAVSSLAGYRGLPGAAGYSASKAALTAMMESLRLDLRDRGIDVTVLVPGFVRTKPGKKRKRKKPLQMELERATDLMVRAIERRKAFYAFPMLLRFASSLSRVLPPAIYDRLLGGGGSKSKGDTGPSKSSQEG
jgi:short-subunit dehydrogenase